MKTAELLDLAQARTGAASDYRLAKNLGVSRQLVSQWRTGIPYPSLLPLFHLADLAGRPPAEVLAELEAERAERCGRIDQVEGWRGVLQRLQAVAATLAGAAILAGAPISSEASSGAGSRPISGGNSLYIVATKRRRRSRLADAVHQASTWWAPITPAFNLA